MLALGHRLTWCFPPFCSADEKSGDTYCADTTTGVWCCPTDKPVTNKNVKILKKSFAKSP